MRRPHGLATFLLLISAFSFAQSASVRRVQVLNSRNAVEIEIEASDRLVPQTQVLTGPDRLVLDFPNTTPSATLHSQSISRGEVQSVRVGLFQSKPPVTRVVLDLRSPQSYQVFPNGRTVMIKVTAAQQQAEGIEEFPPVALPQVMNASLPVSSAHAAGFQSIAASNSPLQVSFRGGMLSIHANKISLSQVLNAVHQRTGADVAVAAGAEQEQVVADLGPAPAPEVLAHLLNGSRFNFLILSSAGNPNALERVILSPKGEGAFTVPALAPSQETSEDLDPDASPAPVARVIEPEQNMPSAMENGPGPQPPAAVPADQAPAENPY